MKELERCIRAGGVALFPSDTVYGLACDPSNADAIARLYALKRRPPAKASAVMFFDLEAALTALPSLGERTRTALNSLMPGGVTVLLPNPSRLYPLACGEDPSTLGLRVIDVPALRGVTVPVLQSSANISGGPEARRLADVPAPLREAVDLEIDGGELPGVASTVVDLRGYEQGDGWAVLREGAVGEDTLREALLPQFHFAASSYDEMIRADIPAFDDLQDRLVAASGPPARRILELGVGTGETSRRLLAHHPDAKLVGIDESEAMLAAARARLPAPCVELRIGRLEDALPEGPFDLVASALCVHHLDGAAKANLFHRVFDVLEPGGRFVLADVVVPDDPAEARVSLTPGYDHPSTVAEQLRWLASTGFDARVAWADGDLAVLLADRHPH